MTLFNNDVPLWRRPHDLYNTAGQISVCAGGQQDYCGKLLLNRRDELTRILPSFLATAARRWFGCADLFAAHEPWLVDELTDFLVDEWPDDAPAWAAVIANRLGYLYRDEELPFATTITERKESFASTAMSQPLLNNPAYKQGVQFGVLENTPISDDNLFIYERSRSRQCGTSNGNVAPLYSPGRVRYVAPPDLADIDGELQIPSLHSITDIETNVMNSVSIVVAKLVVLNQFPEAYVFQYIVTFWLKSGHVATLAEDGPRPFEMYCLFYPEEFAGLTALTNQ